jgi:hypothetical protein
MAVREWRLYSKCVVAVRDYKDLHVEPAFLRLLVVFHAFVRPAFSQCLWKRLFRRGLLVLRILEWYVWGEWG